MNIYVATVLVVTNQNTSAYSELVSLEYCKETFESWIKEEIEAILSDYDISDPDIEIKQYGLNNFSGHFSNSDISITIDIVEKSGEVE